MVVEELCFIVLFFVCEELLVLVLVSFEGGLTDFFVEVPLLEDSFA